MAGGMDSIAIPPVEIGDTVFFIINHSIYEAKVCFMLWQRNQFGEKSEIRGNCPGGTVSASFEEWGKSVFRTREEAEKICYPCEYCFCGSYRSCEGCSWGN